MRTRTVFAPLAGKIEVVEVFGYWCSHCADFQPLVTAWEAKLPKDVRFSYVPMPNSQEDALSLGFYATQAAGTLGGAMTLPSRTRWMSCDMSSLSVVFCLLRSIPCCR